MEANGMCLFEAGGGFEMMQSRVHIFTLFSIVAVLLSLSACGYDVDRDPYAGAHSARQEISITSRVVAVDRQAMSEYQDSTQNDAVVRFESGLKEDGPGTCVLREDPKDCRLLSAAKRFLRNCIQNGYFARLCEDCSAICLAR